MKSEIKKELFLLIAYAIERNFSETVVNLLIEQIGMVQNDEPDFIKQEVEKTLYENGTKNKIAAIRKYRELTGSYLLDAKRWVEDTFGV